jgi:hypothetical protein
MKLEEFARCALSSPSDLAVGVLPFQFTSQRQCQDRIANVAQAADQETGAIEAHDFQSFENRCGRSLLTAGRFPFAKNPPQQRARSVVEQ